MELHHPDIVKRKGGEFTANRNSRNFGASYTSKGTELT